MNISKAAIGIIAAACVTVGATGTYLVTADRTSPDLSASEILDNNGSRADVGTAQPPDRDQRLAVDGPSRHESSSRTDVMRPATTPTDHQTSSALDRSSASGRPPVSSRSSASRRPLAADRTSVDAPSSAAERSAATRRGGPLADRSASDRRGGPSGPPTAAPPFESATDGPGVPAATAEASGDTTAAALSVSSQPPVSPEPQYLDLVIPNFAVIGLQMESSVSSDTARVEDPVTARVTRDVRVGDRIAIPAGSIVHGEVTLVDRGGRLRDRARLGLRFRSVVLSDGTRARLDTEPVYREGDAPSAKSAAKIGGGAIGGAILGGLFGGAKGAVIGGSAGAGAGTAAVLAGGRDAASLESGSPLTIRLQQPATVTVEN